MIRNGVIDAQKEFAERRYRAESDRAFEKLRLNVLEKHGVNIELCRETFVKCQGKIFAVFGDILVDSSSSPPVIEPWDEAKRRINEGR
jgi:hypothetical protein